jgi:hypothetical protein
MFSGPERCSCFHTRPWCRLLSWCRRHTRSCSLTNSSMGTSEFSSSPFNRSRDEPRWRGLRVFWSSRPMAGPRVPSRLSMHCAPCGRRVWGLLGSFSAFPKRWVICAMCLAILLAPLLHPVHPPLTAHVPPLHPAAAIDCTRQHPFRHRQNHFLGVAHALLPASVRRPRPWSRDAATDLTLDALHPAQGPGRPLVPLVIHLVQETSRHNRSTRVHLTNTKSYSKAPPCRPPASNLSPRASMPDRVFTSSSLFTPHMRLGNGG